VLDFGGLQDLARSVLGTFDIMATQNQSGYVPCQCRDCMEIAIRSDDGSHYCLECQEANCADYQGVAGMSQECQKLRLDDDE
jgi:hypothetical protein